MKVFNKTLELIGLTTAVFSIFLYGYIKGTNANPEISKRIAEIAQILAEGNKA